MLRYKLSRIFTAKAERFVPGDDSFDVAAKELMNTNRDYYRDTLVKSLQTVFEKFSSGIVMQSKNTGIGKTTLQLSAPATYPGGTPVEISVSTECSDLLLFMGREAAFCITRGGDKQVFYYGDSYSPDNDSQLLGIPNYIGDIRNIASHVRSMTFHALYDEFQANRTTRKPENPALS